MRLPHDTISLEGALHLSATGEWWHEGQPFTHVELIKLFHRSIVWDESTARYVLRIGAAVADFTCADTAYFVGEIIEDAAGWQVVLFDGSTELLVPASLAVGKEHQIYCTVKGGHRARFSRPAHQHLLRYARTESELEINGERVRLHESV
jgi:hypothetical protein